MHRPQFGIRTLLWLTLVVAAFLGGMAAQKRLAAPISIWSLPATNFQYMDTGDGPIWHRHLHEEPPVPDEEQPPGAQEYFDDELPAAQE
jgi:hypothetical protein